MNVGFERGLGRLWADVGGSWGGLLGGFWGVFWGVLGGLQGFDTLPYPTLPFPANEAWGIFTTVPFPPYLVTMASLGAL